MGFMTNRNNLTGKLPILLVAFAVLAGFQPRTTKAQDIDQLRKTAEQGDSCAQSILGTHVRQGRGSSGG